MFVHARNKRNQTFLLRDGVIDDRGCLAFSSMLQFLRVHPDHGMGCNACQISVLISNIDVIEMNVKCPKNHFQTFVFGKYSGRMWAVNFTRNSKHHLFVSGNDHPTI
jgi:hypothetical protein